MCDTLHTHIAGAGIQIQVRYLDSYWLKGQYGPRFVVLGVNEKDIEIYKKHARI